MSRYAIGFDSYYPEEENNVESLKEQINEAYKDLENAKTWFQYAGNEKEEHDAFTNICEIEVQITQLEAAKDVEEDDKKMEEIKNG